MMSRFKGWRKWWTRRIICKSIPIKPCRPSWLRSTKTPLNPSSDWRCRRKKRRRRWRKRQRNSLTSDGGFPSPPYKKRLRGRVYEESVHPSHFHRSGTARLCRLRPVSHFFHVLLQPVWLERNRQRRHLYRVVQLYQRPIGPSVLEFPEEQSVARGRVSAHPTALGPFFGSSAVCADPGSAPFPHRLFSSVVNVQRCRRDFVDLHLRSQPGDIEPHPGGHRAFLFEEQLARQWGNGLLGGGRHGLLAIYALLYDPVSGGARRHSGGNLRIGEHRRGQCLE